jgi:chemotaxis protein methyltransferase CheR
MTFASPAKLKDNEFQLFSAFIYEQVGIQLPPTKKTMLEARLQKRLKTLDMDSFDAYRKFVFSPEGRQAELVHLIDVVTTNKTDFFREPGHFTYLTHNALPEIIERRGNRPLEPTRIWSAGCSSGEEPYTLAMVLSDFTAEQHGFRFSILATDISTRILLTAKTAIYPVDRINGISENIKKKYLLRSKDRSRGLIRICPEIRSRVSFQRINFMDTDFGIAEKMDIIFCRNVVIYFDKPTQQKLMRKFHHQLRPGGYLFLGHSETLNGIDVDFKSVGSTVYQKT